MRRHATTTALFAGVVLAFALLATLLLPPAASATRPSSHPASVELVPAATDGGQRALMGRLLGKRSDYDPAQARLLVEVAHRVCNTTTRRADWIASFTLRRPSPTTGWTRAEADRFLDAAVATFCTWKVVR